MIIISIILGVLMIFAGISLMCTPLVTFMSAGYFLGIMMFVYGIAGLVRAFQKQSHVFETIMSVLAILVGIIAIIRPGSTLMLDVMILYMTAFWFVMRGITAIVIAIQLKGADKGWIFGVIIGILSIIVGLYSFAHPIVMALATGMLIGLYCVDAGIDMIVVAMTMEQIKELASKESD